jgi:hypothetical protein
VSYVVLRGERFIWDEEPIEPQTLLRPTVKSQSPKRSGSHLAEDTGIIDYLTVMKDYNPLKEKSDPTEEITPPEPGEEKKSEIPSVQEFVAESQFSEQPFSEAFWEECNQVDSTSRKKVEVPASPKKT